MLLTPAFSTGAESYGWNYERQLPAIGVPTCTLSLPDHGFGDLQHDAQYDVAAIRWMSAVSGRKVNLLGHQHGALDGLWAMKFWPDIAAKVHDFISFETPYHGTAVSSGICRPGGECPPSVWQITKGSRFLAALGRRPLPSGPIYTSIASLDDELIFPQPAASHLSGATNVILQHLCPGRVVDHFSVLSDAVAYDVVIDAIDHQGPVNLALLPGDACQQLLMPGTSATALASASSFLPRFAADLVLDAVPQEPKTVGYAKRRA
jgi:hypothetical protein